LPGLVQLLAPLVQEEERGLLVVLPEEAVLRKP
jgi:hypothetical protein